MDPCMLVEAGSLIVTMAGVWIAYRQVKADAQSSIESLKQAHEDARRLERERFYGELDRMYMEILKLRIERPFLGEPETAADDPERRAAYDVYANIVWNFIETIYDRCQNQKDLAAVWRPVVKAESARHQRWLQNVNDGVAFEPTMLQLLRTDLEGKQLGMVLTPPAGGDAR